jgi:hypothetical protein
VSDDALAAEFAAVAPGAAVERRGPLIILTVPHSAPFLSRTARAGALALAAAHGISHLALELLDDGADAPRLPRA